MPCIDILDGGNTTNGSSARLLPHGHRAPSVTWPPQKLSRNRGSCPTLAPCFKRHFPTPPLPSEALAGFFPSLKHRLCPAIEQPKTCANMIQTLRIEHRPGLRGEQR